MYRCALPGNFHRGIICQQPNVPRLSAALDQSQLDIIVVMGQEVEVCATQLRRFQNLFVRLTPSNTGLPGIFFVSLTVTKVTLCYPVAWGHDSSIIRTHQSYFVLPCGAGTRF